MEKLRFFETSSEEKKEYFEKWAAERRRVIEDLKEIKDEIQNKARNHSIGSAVYSGIGTAGGGMVIVGFLALPVTFGTSLGLIAAGTSTELLSGVLGFGHGIFKNSSIKKLCKKARSSLKTHHENCMKMKRTLKTEAKMFDSRPKLDISHENQSKTQRERAKTLVKPLLNSVKSSKAFFTYQTTESKEEATKVMDPEKSLDDMIPSYVKEVTFQNSSNVPREGLAALAALGVITNLFSLFEDISELTSDELCVEAQKIQDIIEQMEYEYDVMQEYYG